MKGVIVAITVNLNNQLDRSYENQTLTEILDAPVSALEGISPRDAEVLASTFGFRTVRDLGTNKVIRLAVELTRLDGLSRL